MIVRKFLLLLGLISAMSTAAFGADATVLHVTGTGTIAAPSVTKPYEPAVLSGDEIITPPVSGEITFPAVSGTNYTFETVVTALNFARYPKEYINNNYDFSLYPASSYDVAFDSTLEDRIDPVEISIEIDELDSTVDLSSYRINEIIFTADRSVTVPEGSRHFKVAGDSTTTRTFRGITFSGQGNSGGVEVNSGTANFNNTTFSSCYTSGNGGAILITGGTVTVRSSDISGSSAVYGGGIALTGGSATISSTVFKGNSATYGGGVYSSSGLTIAENTEFNNTTALSPNTADRGGALYVDGGTANISGANVSFTQNNADYGGALYAARGVTNISGYGALFTENVASSDGGAIYAGSNAALNLTGDNLQITSNTATEGDGGGIYLASSVNLTLSSAESLLRNNQSLVGNGGAIYANGSNTLTLSGAATIRGNSAENGGAIYLARARLATNLNIEGSSEFIFTSNIASSDGGAIYAEANANMTFEPEVTFSGNFTNNGNGGALWVSELSELPDGTVYFEGNQARKASRSSTTTGSGGAIYAEGSSTSSATIGTTKFYTFTNENTAQSYGGAFCSSSGDVTFVNYTGSNDISSRNNARLGGGFAASYTGIVRISNCSIYNQAATEGSGGAIWAKSVVVTSADFGSSSLPNQSQGTGNNHGGGAIYSNGSISLTNVQFNNNNATQGGGAVYADTASVTIRNSYFYSNNAERGNGGAIILRNYCNTNISATTFTSNRSDNLDGGAVYAQGRIEITQSYFNENISRRSGGAIYFDQSNSQEPYSFFSISNSMLTDNSTLGGSEGGNGGGIFAASNRVVITSCTFNKNHIDLSGNSGEGGGVYLNTATYQSGTNTIENCTFYENTINDGADGSSGGGGLSVHCEGRTNITSCTFSMNASRYKGGAIYLGSEDGTLTLSGTIAVGNSSFGIYDIWSDGNISSGGYNRIGVYGTGSGVTDFYSETRNETDRTSYPAKGWTKATFFSSNVLSDNKRPDIGDTIPPFIGSVRAGQVRLLTLMLNEADDLSLTDRATNIIPYTRRTSFPNNDERGVSRVSGGAEINLDVGACFFDGTRPNSDNPPISSYTITKVEIGGIPNNLRRVGQTASLIAKVYYSNGRTALGGTGDGEEPIEWSSDKPNIIRINKDTGDITVLNFTPANTYVTITAKTIRTDLSGAQVADSQPIRVTEYTYSYLNTTPQIMNYINDYIEDIAEYDISLQLPDVSSSYVSSSSFQSAFSSAWGGVSASQVTDISDGSLTLNKQTTGYTTSDGFKSAKNIAVNVNMRNRNTGDVFPLTYAWMFSGSELDNILGYNLSGRSLTDEVIDTIFSTLRLDFQGAATSLPVIGTGGVKASEARAAGVLTLEKSDAEKGLRAELTAYLANVSTSSGVASSASDGPQLISSAGTKLLVVPDGSGNDGAIYGTMWAASKSDAGSGSNNSNSNNNGSSNSSSGGGGGGCNAGWLGGIVAGIFIFAKRYKDVQEG